MSVSYITICLKEQKLKKTGSIGANAPLSEAFKSLRKR
jgi:hypothetical protein